MVLGPDDLIIAVFGNDFVDDTDVWLPGPGEFIAQGERRFLIKCPVVDGDGKGEVTQGDVNETRWTTDEVVKRIAAANVKVEYSSIYGDSLVVSLRGPSA
jgi:hypothetical protein